MSKQVNWFLRNETKFYVGRFRLSKNNLTDSNAKILKHFRKSKKSEKSKNYVQCFPENCSKTFFDTESNEHVLYP